MSGAGTKWRVVPASVVGPHHVRASKGTQDAWAEADIGRGIKVLAVADGAGSRDRSDQGSKYAVEAAKGAAMSLKDRPPRSLTEWNAALTAYTQKCFELFDRSVDKHIEALAIAKGPEASPSDFATTLLTVLVAPPVFAYMSVGDGFLLCHRDPGGVQLVQAPDLGREHSGQTTFLTSPGRSDAVNTGLILDDRITGLALCTDGMLEGLLSIQSEPDGSSRWVAPPETGTYFTYFSDKDVDAGVLTERLASPAFAETSGDDKTMLLSVQAK